MNKFRKFVLVGGIELIAKYRSDISPSSPSTFAFTKDANGKNVNIYSHNILYIMDLTEDEELALKI